MRKTLSSIGGSLGIIIDKPILEALGITKTTILNLSIEGGALLIRPEPQRSGSSREEFEDWARSLLVRVSAWSEDVLPKDLVDEIARFEETLPIFINLETSGEHPARSSRPPDKLIRHSVKRIKVEPVARSSREVRAWLQQVVQQLSARKPPPPRPILTRQTALAVLEELADARGTYREITAARPFAGASPDVVAHVLWFLLSKGYAEVHPDSSTIRPTLEHLRRHGQVPESVPDSLTDSFQHGVTLLRLTARGGDYLHELRNSER